MKFYFSKRHEDALKQKRLIPSLPVKLRISIIRILEKYSSWSGYNGDNWTFEKTEEQLKTFYGEDNLLAYDINKNLVPTNLAGLIRNGYPSKVLDSIEVWCDNADPKETLECQKELNNIFEIHNSPWRIANGTVFLVDSQYLHNEITTKTQSLLQVNSMAGPLEEFTEAITCLTDGQTKDAIINAHKSVESVMKSILNVQEHVTFGRLLADTIKSGIIPEYYEDFFKHFEQLALGAVKERNKPGTGHGQGVQPVEVPKSLAEFSVHLAGTINLFLIRRWLETQPSKDERKSEINQFLDNLPF